MSRAISNQIEFLTHNARWLGGGFLLTFFSSFGQTFFIGLSGSAIRARYDLTDGEFGSLYMLATLGSALTLPWLGRTLDLMAGWKVAAFCLPALALACVIVTVAPGLILLILALYLLRLFGQGMMTEIAFTEVGRWFSAERGRAMALVSIGLHSGSALLPALYIWVSMAGGWQSTWIAAALLILLVGWPAVTWLIRVERQPHSRDTEADQLRTARDWTRGEVVCDPVFYLLLFGLLAPPFIGTVVFFHLAHLIEVRGYDPLIFAGAFPVMSLTTVILGLVFGQLSDRYGSLRLLPVILLPLAVAALIIATVTPVWGIYLFMLLLGVSQGASHTLIAAMWPEVYGLANLGGIRAIVISAMVLSTAIGPSITGMLIDAGVDLPQQMLWMAGWCVLAMIALFVASRIALARRLA